MVRLTYHRTAHGMAARAAPPSTRSKMTKYPNQRHFDRRRRGFDFGSASFEEPDPAGFPEGCNEDGFSTLHINTAQRHETRRRHWAVKCKPQTAPATSAAPEDNEVSAILL